MILSHRTPRRALVLVVVAGALVLSGCTAAQGGKTLGVEVAPQLPQLSEQGLRRGVGQRQALDFEYGSSKTCRYQGVAPIVHVYQILQGRWPA